MHSQGCVIKMGLALFCMTVEVCNHEITINNNNKNLLLMLPFCHLQCLNIFSLYFCFQIFQGLKRNTSCKYLWTTSFNSNGSRGTENVIWEFHKVNSVNGVCSWRDCPATTSCPNSAHCSPHSSPGRTAPQVFTPLLPVNSAIELRAIRERYTNMITCKTSKAG